MRSIWLYANNKASLIKKNNVWLWLQKGMRIVSVLRWKLTLTYFTRTWHTALSQHNVHFYWNSQEHLTQTEYTIYNSCVSIPYISLQLAAFAMFLSRINVLVMASHICFIWFEIFIAFFYSFTMQPYTIASIDCDKLQQFVRCRGLFNATPYSFAWIQRCMCMTQWSSVMKIIV